MIIELKNIFSYIGLFCFILGIIIIFNIYPLGSINIIEWDEDMTILQEKKVSEEFFIGNGCSLTDVVNINITQHNIIEYIYFSITNHTYFKF